MGATAHYKSISPWALEILQAHPWLVEAFVLWCSPNRTLSPLRDSLPRDQRLSLEAELSALFPEHRENFALTVAARRHPVEMTAVRAQLAQLQAEWDAPGLDIHKAWRGIMSALDRCAPDVARACGDAVWGGAEVGEDLGYGPARFHEDTKVRELAEALPAAVAYYREFSGDYVRELEYVSNYYVQAAALGHAMLLHLA